MLSNNTKMVPYGRGRARSTSKDIEIPLRKPGENVLCQNNESPYNDIVEIINNLTINDSILLKPSNEISHLLQDIKDSQALQAISDGLITRSLEDKAFSKKLARLFIDKSFYVIQFNNNNSIRYLLINYLQKSYERREEIKKENEELLRNIISLHGEINHLKPVIVMERTLIDYFNMLLETTTEEDIEIITTQVIINGNILYRDCLNKLNEFILNVRKTLVNNTLSPSAKKMLLLIIDLANHKFNSLPKDLYDYYTSDLSTAILMNLQMQQNDIEQDRLTHNTGNKYGAVKQKIYQRPKKPSKANLKEKTVVEEKNCTLSDTTVIYTGKKDFAREHTAPRAIRGPGASTADKSSKTRSNSFTGPISSSRKIKEWGHDDRFENDYE